MKTLFALLGLFMFASVSSTGLSNESGDQIGGKKALIILGAQDDQPVLTAESGDQIGGKKALIILG
jgi:hypothetical protein